MPCSVRKGQIKKISQHPTSVEGEGKHKHRAHCCRCQRPILLFLSSPSWHLTSELLFLLLFFTALGVSSPPFCSQSWHLALQSLCHSFAFFQLLLPLYCGLCGLYPVQSKGMGAQPPFTATHFFPLLFCAVSQTVNKGIEAHPHLPSPRHHVFLLKPLFSLAFLRRLSDRE